MSSLNLNSFAGILSDDTGYETFEGNNITINDILEEDKVDVEIEGNSFVNVFDYSKLEKLSDIPNSYGFSINDREITRDYTSVQGIEPVTYLKTTEEIIKKGETYTFVIDITNNTLNERIEFYPYLWSYAEWFKGDKFIQPSYIGKAIVSFKAMADARVKLLYAHNYPTYTGSISMTDIMLLKGDYYDEFTNNPSSIPEYFEGIKSVGELEGNKLNVEALGENFFDVDYFKSLIEANYDEGEYGYEVKDGRNTVWVVNNHRNMYLKNVLNNYYKFKKNKQYIIKYSIFNDENNPNLPGLRGNVDYTDGTSSPFFNSNVLGTWISKTDISQSNKTIKRLNFVYGTGYSKVWFDLDSLYIAEYSPDKTEFNHDYNAQNIEINLKQPLRGLPNGAKDRIIKRNGQWVIERNCAEITIDTSSVYMYREQIWDDYYGAMININKKLGMKLSRLSGINYYYDNFITYPNYWNMEINYSANKQNMYCVSPKPDEYMNLFSKIPKVEVDLYTGTDDEKVNQWFEDNCDKLNIVYQLETPIYESLNIDSTINLYLNTTHISNNSTIPANMKITIDRTLNRAIEAIELAKSNPTIENLSKARMWSNLLKESIEKDELQNEINNITNIDDLQIEKNNITSNMDVYIKPQNSLSMTLSTNSIIFEEFSGVENMEKLNAVDITISSSLPYQLNSYLESEIKNSDGSKIIPKELLNIRLNGENDYKAFSNINEKLVLKENCLKENDNQFSVDLILKGDLTHRADIYKTVIKFEVEQR